MTATITRLSVGLRPAAKIEQPVDDGRRRVAHRGTLCRVSVEVIARAELVRRAGSTAAARRLVGDGDWVRVLRNAYVPRGTPDGIPARAAALRLVLPSDVAVAGRAALWLVGVPLLDEVVDVVVPRGRHLSLAPESGLGPLCCRTRSCARSTDCWWSRPPAPSSTSRGRRPW